MLNHSDVITLLRNDLDRDILTRPLFDVNMRLFETSPEYRRIVTEAAEYIHLLARTERPGYKKPHGMSGANVGIPFNIIATPEEVMLNPRIIWRSERFRTGFSNCGSLLLDAPIKIWRHAKIEFEFYDLNGEQHQRQGYYPTIQHEIDHNQGILITERRVE